MFPRTAATFACPLLAACAATEPTYYNRGLEIREGLPGPESRCVADFLNDLAAIRRTPSRYDDVRPRAREADRLGARPKGLIAAQEKYAAALRTQPLKPFQAGTSGNPSGRIHRVNAQAGL